MRKEETAEFIEDRIGNMFDDLYGELVWYEDSQPTIDKLMQGKILLTNVWKQFCEMEMIQ